MSKFTQMFKELTEVVRLFYEYCIDEYKANKNWQKKQAQHDADIERKISEGVVYNEKTGMYHFETVAEHNGTPRTFSCDSQFKDICQNGARLRILEAEQYEMFGPYTESAGDEKQIN